MRTIAIVGSRSITDEQVVVRAFTHVAPYDDEVHIITGDCPTGIDRAVRNLFPSAISHTADWEKYGRRAGPIRNKAIVSLADVVCVVWDGQSRGSRNVIELALAAQKELHVFFP